MPDGATRSDLRGSSGDSGADSTSGSSSGATGAACPAGTTCQPVFTIKSCVTNPLIGPPPCTTNADCSAIPGAQCINVFGSTCLRPCN